MLDGKHIRILVLFLHLIRFTLTFAFEMRKVRDYNILLFIDCIGLKMSYHHIISLLFRMKSNRLQRLWNKIMVMISKPTYGHQV